MATNCELLLWDCNEWVIEELGANLEHNYMSIRGNCFPWQLTRASSVRILVQYKRYIFHRVNRQMEISTQDQIEVTSCKWAQTLQPPTRAVTDCLVCPSASTSDYLVVQKQWTKSRSQGPDSSEMLTQYCVIYWAYIPTLMLEYQKAYGQCTRRKLIGVKRLTI